jgi:molybdenum cofactor cytidylyltransferase
MTGLIILAAGQSSRMGRPKQNLQYKGKSLLQHAVHTAMASECRPIVVVLGAYAANILTGIKNEPIIVIHNPQWAEGMASSIRAGIAELEKQEDIDSAIIMLCDQPFVDAALINNLIQLKTKSGKGIVACAYQNTLGVPVLFDKSYFAQLLFLKGNEGAKKLLTQYGNDLAAIPFAPGDIDIDTPTDYNKLL